MLVGWLAKTRGTNFLGINPLLLGQRGLGGMLVKKLEQRCKAWL